MTDLDATLEAYSRRRPLQSEFTERLKELMAQLLRTRGVAIHALEARTKDLGSFREKIVRSGKSYAEPLQDVTDLSGLRVIAYYADDVRVVEDLVRHEFAVDEAHSGDKAVLLEPNEFGYQSFHFVVRLSAGRAQLAEWRHLSHLTAEIQVRSVLQHAWAAISHKLQYKREVDAPLQLRRRLFRLSALLELADDEFKSLRDSTGDLAREIQRELRNDRTEVLLDRLSLEEYIRTSREVDHLLTIALEAGFSLPTSDSDETDSDSISDLLTLLGKVEITSIRQVRDVVREALTWAPTYLTQQKDASLGDWEVSAAFLIELLVIKSHRQKVRAGDLMRLGWDRAIATRVLRLAET